MDESRSAGLLRQIKEVAEVAGIRTEEYAKIAKKRLDVLSLTRDLGRERAALGERVYDLAHRSERDDILDDVSVQAVIGRIAGLEQALIECSEEIADIRRAAGERATEARRRGEPGAAGTRDRDGWTATPASSGAAAAEPVVEVEALEIEEQRDEAEEPDEFGDGGLGPEPGPEPGPGRSS